MYDDAIHLCKVCQQYSRFRCNDKFRMQLSNYGINTIHMQVTAEWIHKLFGNKKKLFR